MAFVKIDTNILNSSLWPEKTQRDIFLTALFLAEPYEVIAPEPQLYTREIKATGWKVPPGWYGIIKGASVGILYHAGIDKEEGLQALEALASPDPDSRSQDYEGRRLVRINGGYIALNYMKYRERDTTAAERSKRWRLKQKAAQEEAEKLKQTTVRVPRAGRRPQAPTPAQLAEEERIEALSNFHPIDEQ